MAIKTEDIGGYIEKYFENNHKELVITKRIKEGLQAVILNNIDFKKPYILGENLFLSEELVDDLLRKENVINFVRERQPNIQRVSDDVIANISEYFSRHLPGYQLVQVCRKSNHPEDANLYSVVASKDKNEFACWTSWNNTTRSLNYGHYGLHSEHEASETLEEAFYDITGETEKYGIESTKRQIEENNNFEMRRRKGGR